MSIDNDDIPLLETIDENKESDDNGEYDEEYDIHEGDIYYTLSDDESERSNKQEDSDLEEEYESDVRKMEKEKRSEYFEVHSGESYGKGKREKKHNSFNFLQKKHQKQPKRLRRLSYSFLQKHHGQLSFEQRKKYFQKAWKSYLATGHTNQLERYTTGFLFAQMSAKQVIKNMGDWLN